MRSCCCLLNTKNLHEFVATVYADGLGCYWEIILDIVEAKYEPLQRLTNSKLVLNILVLTERNSSRDWAFQSSSGICCDLTLVPNVPKWFKHINIWKKNQKAPAQTSHDNLRLKNGKAHDWHETNTHTISFFLFTFSSLPYQKRNTFLSFSFCGKINENRKIPFILFASKRFSAFLILILCYLFLCVQMNCNKSNETKSDKPDRRRKENTMSIGLREERSNETRKDNWHTFFFSSQTSDETIQTTMMQ